MSTAALLALGSGGEGPILYDARDRAAVPPGVLRAADLSAATVRTVLSRLAPQYVTAREQCTPRDEVFLAITAAARGRFTTAGADETAYIVDSELCRPQYAQTTAATHLLIFRGEELVAQASGKGMVEGDEPSGFFGTDIRGLADVDGDGASELLVTSAGFGQGIYEEVARLYRARGGKIELLQEVQGSYVDSCEGGDPRAVEALVLRAAPGGASGKSALVSEAFVAPCVAAGEPKPADFRPRKSPGR